MLKKIAYIFGWVFLFIAFGFFFMDLTSYFKNGLFHATSLTSYFLSTFPMTTAGFIKGSGILWQVLRYPFGWPATLVVGLCGILLLRYGR